MLAEEAKEYVNSYLAWLKTNLRVAQVDGAAVISTPFLDRHNDEIEIFVERNGDQIVLTDDGYTLRDLASTGVDLTSGSRKSHLYRILAGFGVSVESDELIVRATPSEFGQKKHNLLQAILSVDDLYVTAHESVLQFFREDVEKFLLMGGVPVFPDLKLSGKSGFDHHFDIGLPASPTSPVRILQAVNSLRKESVASLAFAVRDVRDARGVDALGAYAMINDTEKAPKPEHLSALQAWGIKPLLWSNRSDCLPELKLAA